VESVLTTYLSTRLETLLKALDLDWLGFLTPNATNSSLLLQSQAGNFTRTRTFYTIPIVFDSTRMGQLHVASHSLEAFESWKLREQLEGFACQIAVLCAAPNKEKAILLDREMEKLQKENRQYDWCGIYRLESKKLLLTAFRGPATPHVVIPENEGICGAAVRENRSLNIPDVTVDPRYLSCDSRTRSEIVIPIRNGQGQAIAEIDIDSFQPNAFTALDSEKLEKLARSLACMLN